MGPLSKWNSDANTLAFEKASKRHLGGEKRQIDKNNAPARLRVQFTPESSSYAPSQEQCTNVTMRVIAASETAPIERERGH